MEEKKVELTEYVETMAILMKLPLTPEYSQGVVENFARIEALAKLFLEFPLPEEIEAAPIFEP
ncbi:MAG: DUF4089 domain-containing protein [Oscillatoriaceae bacterium SKW80]|nr:DUF4089 domain-containing protein [Oscillatoriaceae bacterium SKYG93]MCX8119381.1 DUF4089 domain-containing protein [Oscillatoriaceae bacterium SKW80]MDW8454848.1 DUF4089 domain-containing protein [Oscillatoriaceae cyanobacterium SKYGB_i_bin93]HIK28373.1 DUF4089 domain-containing protein [Oscillatoriaceae cyanobacterium M7585_C2015_266]